MRQPQENGERLQASLQRLHAEDAPFELDAIRHLPVSDPVTRSSVLAFVLRKLGCDPSPRVRADAAVVLGEISDPAAVPGLLEALRDPDANVNWQVACDLGTLKHSAAVAGLIKAVRNPLPCVRAFVAWVLGAHHIMAAVPVLLKALGDPDQGVRSYAGVALAQFRYSEVGASLLSALRDDPSPTVREEAVWALRWQNDPQSVSALLATLLNDGGGWEFGTL